MCEHTVSKHPIPPPLDPQENYKRRSVVTMWLTGTKCIVCNEDNFTDGKTIWCSHDCRKDGKKMGSTGTDFQYDHMR